MTATIITPAQFDAIDPLALGMLRGALRGQLYTPQDHGYAEHSAPWQRHVTQRPAAVIMAAGAEDIVAAVRFAGAYGLPVAVQATGHGAVVPCDGGLLINTSAMQGVWIDPAARTAAVEAGVKWGPVLAAAQAVGLAPLLGSTTDVGVVGYSLGGGLGWLAGKYGLAVDSVRAFDIVTADGQLRHVSAQSDPELFWGVRGGAGNFGVVTRIEFALYPITEVYAGNLFFPMERAREVIAAYRAWIRGLSDDWTTGISLMHMPPEPFIPEPLRGQSVMIVRGCYAGPAAQGEADMRPIRALGGIIVDAFGPMPFTAADNISQDPVDPMSAVGRTETLSDLDPETVETLLKIMGQAGESPIIFAEVRHLSGAARRAPSVPSAFGHRDMEFVTLTLAGIFEPAMEQPALRALRDAGLALAAHRTGQIYLNFLHDSDTTGARVRAGYTPETYARLVALKDRYDPANMFRFNRNIAPSAAI